LYDGMDAPNQRGISVARPIANSERVAAVAPEFALARQLLRWRNDEQPADRQDRVGHEAPRVAVVERVEPGHLVGPEVDRGGVVVEDVEQADEGRPTR
jgi:hypothetical protein